MERSRIKTESEVRSPDGKNKAGRIIPKTEPLPGLSRIKNEPFDSVTREPKVEEQPSFKLEPEMGDYQQAKHEAMEELSHVDNARLELGASSKPLQDDDDDSISFPPHMLSNSRSSEQPYTVKSGSIEHWRRLGDVIDLT